jgi:quinol-cytochrome oxidoreductase complex cytochrome b subunit
VPDERKSLADRAVEWVARNVNLRAIINIVATFTGFLYGELDERLELKEAIVKQFRKPISGRVSQWWGCFGGITFVLFMIQVVTGVLLAVYYRPTTEGAYNSILFIMNDVRYGWLIRSVHRYAAELMVLTVMIHMAKVFLAGAYKPPRELTWVSGVVLLTLTLAFGFTGYLLPWDQRAYWATTVGTEMAHSVPLVGKYLAAMLRGGDVIGQPTVSRFYTLHVIVLPWAVAFLLMSHFLMIRRQGAYEPL